MAITIIGVDCATQDKKVGIARGYFESGRPWIEEVAVGSSLQSSLPDVIAGWIRGSSSVLITLDAPLGWPLDLGQTLNEHKAGDAIQVKPNDLFRRLTDRVVRQEIGKQSLDVGADHIARTAHAALKLIETLRLKTGEDIPLAWHQHLGLGTYVIEVYPSATLKVYGIDNSGYKYENGFEARKRLLASLARFINLPSDLSLLENNDNALDAVICVLAGVDFLTSGVIEPSDIEVAKKEGWIWVRKPPVL